MIAWIDNFIISYFLLVNSFYALLLGLAFLEIRRRKAERLPELDPNLLGEGAIPPITTIMPAFDEEETIVESVKALRNVNYPNHEIIVVNDGSTDNTLERLADEFDLEPSARVVERQLETEPVRQIYEDRSADGLVVVDKKNGGKGDALNTGINVSRTPLVCCVDADTLVARDALLRMVEPYIYDAREVVAVGGTVRISNGCRIEDRAIAEFRLPDSWLARFQIIEYLRAFLFGRMGMNRIGGNLIISGAFGLFRKDAVVEVGGYDNSVVTEDMELIMKLHRYGRQSEPTQQVIQIPDPTSFTQAPEEFGLLRRQRDRWHRGMAESIWKHISMLFNPKLGPLGMIVVPSYLLFELLGPFVELFGYGWFATSVIFGFIEWEFALLFLLLAVVWGAILSIQALVLDYWSFGLFRGGRERWPLLATAISENLGYRQLTLVYRIVGFFKFLTGRGSWGEMQREAYEKTETEEAREEAPDDKSDETYGLGEESSHPIVANESVEGPETSDSEAERRTPATSTGGSNDADSGEPAGK